MLRYGDGHKKNWFRALDYDAYIGKELKRWKYSWLSELSSFRSDYFITKVKLYAISFFIWNISLVNSQQD